jgi:hypothetical protein
MPTIVIVTVAFCQVAQQQPFSERLGELRGHSGKEGQVEPIRVLASNQDPAAQGVSGRWRSTGQVVQR